ncbi:hypothetical protein ACFPDQ_07125 [Pseudofrancisella aestuarii]|uniref:Uncharacterized protein n=1 Tax=Pseudofrancisella aestuarii TaxID=2670347 RepID=A0ABV9TCE2_9GAMM|nr:hypothetical protein [Pseudofrancisella aestuarii]
MIFKISFYILIFITIFFAIPTLYICHKSNNKNYLKVLNKVIKNNLLISIFVIFVTYCSIQQYTDKENKENHHQYVEIEKNKVIFDLLLHGVQSQKNYTEQYNIDIKQKLFNLQDDKNKCFNQANMAKCLITHNTFDTQTISFMKEQAILLTVQLINSESMINLYKQLGFNDELDKLTTEYLIDLNNLSNIDDLNLIAKQYAERYDDKINYNEAYGDQKEMFKANVAINMNLKTINYIYTKALMRYLKRINDIMY